MVAVGLARVSSRREFGVARNLLIGLGIVLAAVAAPPWPLVIPLALGVVTLAWLVGEARGGRWRTAVRGLMVAAWLGAAGAEAPHHVVPPVPRLGGGPPTLGIIGDSLTAGTDDADATTWQGRLAARHGVVVRDHAVAGATVGSALRQAQAVEPAERLLLLEIGGNDLLGGTSLSAFEAGLARLLDAVCQPGRTVLLLELPLIPGYQGFFAHPAPAGGAVGGDPDPRNASSPASSWPTGPRSTRSTSPPSATTGWRGRSGGSSSQPTPETGTPDVRITG